MPKVKKTPQEELIITKRSLKRAWRSFYSLRESFNTLCEFTNDVRTGKRKEINSKTKVDANYLKKQFIELYTLVKKQVECPVCYEVLTNELLYVPLCGHLICKLCKSKIDGNCCPLCKQKFI